MIFPQLLIRKYLRAIRRQVLWVRRGKSVLISFPFVMANGHYVQVYIEKKKRDFIVVSDQGEGIGHLWLDGFDDARKGKRRKLIEQIVCEHELTITNDDEIQGCGHPKHTVRMVHDMIQVLLKVGELGRR